MESPVIVENCTNFAMPIEQETGFPFDDSDFDSNNHLQDRLNDIAQRHPQFANHLRFDDFPSFRRKRQGSGSSSTDQDFLRRGTAGPSSRFTGHSFPSGFNRFFEQDFAGEEKPPEVPRSQETRGRKPNPNLPQHLSNTVDLGQKQPPVEETRTHRSMSAPPENRSTQNTTKVVETELQNEPTNMGSSSSRPQSNQPKERIIPIHVEGRDDPIIPKNTATPQQPQYQNYPKSASPTPEKVFGGERVHTGFHRPDPQANIRRQMYDQFVPQPPRHQSQFTKQQTPPPGQFTKQQTPPPQHYPQQAPPPQQYQQQVPPPNQKQATPPPSQKPQPHPSNDPLDKIKKVKNDVLELMTQVEKFQGTRKDKEYLYLDEMLTLNLIKLDDVDTDGKDNIRTARKEAIKCIQTCISNLEAKAQAKEKELKTSEVASQPDQSNEPMQTDSEPQSTDPPKFTSQATLIMGGNNKSDQSQSEEKMDDDKTTSQDSSAITTNPSASTANMVAASAATSLQQNQESNAQEPMEIIQETSFKSDSQLTETNSSQPNSTKK